MHAFQCLLVNNIFQKSHSDIKAYSGCDIYYPIFFFLRFSAALSLPCSAISFTDKQVQRLNAKIQRGANIMTSAVTLPPGQKPIPMAKPCPRLLVVGDPPTTADPGEIFQRDHEVFVAGNGVKTVEICRSILPDLILLDAVMPDMDGLEVCRRLKADPDTKDIPVILLIRPGQPGS